MRSRKPQVRAKFHKVPDVVFEDSCELTSYAGLTVFQRLFAVLDLRARLRGCFAHMKVRTFFGLPVVVLLLVVHLLLGFRRLRGLEFYDHDPLVRRVLGLRCLPDVSTVSRALASVDELGVRNLEELSRVLVTDRLRAEGLDRLTLDFDGSVQSTKGHAEGTAVGFNKKKKGARSYYPLYCTVAQTGQFLDLLHRSGNVHDSNGAEQFITECIENVRSACPGAALEARLDSAFFSDPIIDRLDSELVAFTCSVAFERFPELKAEIEQRRRWRRIDSEWSYFERSWKPKSWTDEYRFLFVRRRRKVQIKGPLQLDLFEPRTHEYEYKVVVTNRLDEPAADVIQFHNGRGSQEKIFGEGKQHAALDLVPTKRRRANQVFTLAGMLAHNLGRELQMRTYEPERATEPTRPALWKFAALGTLRQRVLHTAGLLVRPQGRLTLKVADNPSVRGEFTDYLDAFEEAA